MHKLLNPKRNRRPRRRKEIRPLQSQAPLDERQHRPLIERILHPQSHRRNQAPHTIPHIVSIPHTHSIAKQRLLHLSHTLHPLNHTIIHLLPQTRHRTHTRRVHLTHTPQDILRPMIDSQPHPQLQTQIRPRPLKHMSERQETQSHVLLTQTQHPLISPQSRIIHPMRHHHPLSNPRSPTRIENISKIVPHRLRSPTLHLLMMRQTTAQLKEVIKKHTHRILSIQHHPPIKHNNPLQSRPLRQHPKSNIILILSPHKNKTHRRITHHILHLRLTTRRIKRNRHRPHPISPKVHKQTLRPIKRKHRHPLLHLHTQRHQSTRHLTHTPREIIPPRFPPRPRHIIAKRQSTPTTIPTSLRVHQPRQHISRKRNNTHGSKH